MVSVSKTPSVGGGESFERWLEGFDNDWNESQQHALRRAYQDAQHHVPDRDGGLQAADLLRDLNMDHEAILAALLHEAVDCQALELDAISERYGSRVAQLVDSATQLNRISDWHQSGRSQEQLERLRKMLLAIAQDIRVVVIMLAIRLCKLRAQKQLPASEAQRLAQETLDIFAPLANRLGIGQLKWELEDLALRTLKPEVYKTLAQALDERRADRENYIQQVMQRLQAALEQAGLKAEVSGRAKHIYSIWRKMRRKQLLFEQLSDVRAVRLMVHTVAECYAVLGHRTCFVEEHQSGV